MKSIKAVLFDLDGTLVDSAPDLWGALNHVLAGRGYPLLALEQVRHLVGDGARALLARGFWGEAAEPPVQDNSFEEAVSAFMCYYRQHLTDHSQVFPGVIQALQTLKNREIAMAVVTNKPEELARRMLEQLQLLAFFVLSSPVPSRTRPSRDSSQDPVGSLTTVACVIGGDTLPQRKPAAEPLLYALAQLDVSPESAVMVGDSSVDVEAARAAGCSVVWVSHGYHRGLTAQQLNPDWVLDDFKHLPQIVRCD